MQTFESTSLLAFLNRDRTPLASCWSPNEIAEITDLAGYDVMVDFIRREGLDQLPGDFLEIGCFLGGGTGKLAKHATSVGKQVWVVDVFDPAFDLTRHLAGDRMSDIYDRFLKGRTQEEIFRQATERWSGSIHVLKQDSMKVRFPDGLRFAFAFTNGNHDPRWVNSDFNRVWKHLTAGGWAAFGDYGGDLPDVTAALDSLMELHRAEIGRIETVKEQRILLVQKMQTTILQEGSIHEV